MKKVALVGCGNLGSMIASKIVSGECGAYTLEWALDTYAPCAQKIADEHSCKVASSLQDILDAKPDYVVEASTVSTVKEIAPHVLGAGISLIALSVGALADSEFYSSVCEIAQSSGAKIHIPSGAAGGFDLLAATMMGGGDIKVCITTRKNPKSLDNAPHLEGKTLSYNTVEEIFHGNACEAIVGFPQNVNVAVAVGVASVGVENLDCKVISDPAMDRNRHTISMSGDFGEATVEVMAKPSPNNAKSSLLAAISVMTLLKKLQSPISFG